MLTTGRIGANSNQARLMETATLRLQYLPIALDELNQKGLRFQGVGFTIVKVELLP